MFKFRASDLPKILSLWSSRYAVFVPSGTPDNVQLRLWRQSKQEGERLIESDEYINLAMSPKSFVFSERESLFRWESNEKLCEAISDPFPDASHDGDKILFGVRPCDCYGLGYMDRFFLGEHHDINYHMRRQHVFVVAVNCLQAGKGCFCHSMGTGPFAAITQHNAFGTTAGKGYDLLLTPDYAPEHVVGKNTENDWYWVEAGSDRGKALLSQVAHMLFRDLEFTGLERKEALLRHSRSTFSHSLEAARQPELLARMLSAHYNDPCWDALAERCIDCTGCTRVCPTCTCFTTEEEKDSEHSGMRVRVWDSCQSRGFTRNAGWHNPRSKTASLRYRIFDKLQYIEERFGMKGCVGCGRCFTVCPAAINFVDVINDMAQRMPVAEVMQNVPHRDVHYERDERLFDPQLYTPLVAEIIDIHEEARNINRYTVRYRDRPNQGRPALRGQFFMLTVFGVGEVAISVPFSDRVKDGFTFYVKKAGKVTSAMHKLKVGDMMGLRGPFGVPLPYDSLIGRDLLVVGSGVGHAPVRATLVRAIENKQHFGRIAIMASATSYDGLILKDDLKEWAQIDGVEVHYCLSKPTDAVQAHVGYINDLLPGLGLNWGNTSAIVCASARRIKAVARDLMQLGMKPADIYTALETNMHCGVGKCGHCKVGGHYMCVDGPVFTYEEMMQLPPEF
jgi:NAD(P)H-flavin reductase/formate hydrogenlyase subunit 6/NADH:ubiquinone oxidoreductase subunit I